MPRLAWSTILYAMVAALLLVAPLSASEQPAPPAAPAEPVAAAPPVVGVEQPDAAEPVDPAAAPPPEPAPAPAPTPPPAPPAPEPAPAPAAAPPAAPPAPEPQPEPRRAKASVVKLSAAAASTAVTISNYSFGPASITVNVGDTVTWSNADPVGHSATASAGEFDTGIFEEGQSRSHTFQQAGTFAYICTPHPNMTGTVTVEAAAAQGDDGSGTGGDTSGDTGSGSTAGDTDTGTGTTSSGSTSSGSALPATGLDAGGLLALGLFTLAFGALLRRRGATPRPRPAGRIGW